MSLNRYLKSHTLQFHSVYQSDTAFLIIRCKDNTNRVKYKVKTKFSTFNSEVQAILYKDTKNSQNMTKEGQTISDYTPVMAVLHVTRQVHSWPMPPSRPHPEQLLPEPVRLSKKIFRTRHNFHGPYLQ